MQLLTYKTILVVTKPQAQQWSFNYYLLINIAIACMLLKKIIKVIFGLVYHMEKFENSILIVAY